jgi:transcription initiation factor IIF auxiliary subunit
MVGVKRVSIKVYFVERDVSNKTRHQLQLIEDEYNSIEHTRKMSEMNSATLKAGILTIEKIKLEKKVKALEAEREAMQEEQTVVRAAVRGLIKERFELYHMFRHLAKRWGQEPGEIVREVEKSVEIYMQEPEDEDSKFVDDCLTGVRIEATRVEIKAKSSKIKK